MATQYENLGPIYTTTAKYEAMKTAGTLEVGREYKIVDWEAQEKISDLDTIRSGAALGATSIQEHQSLADYRKSDDQDTIDATKQDKLVSGTNLKTINSNSLLGSGDIEVKTFQSFPSDIKTGENGESLSDFISSIENSSGAKEGMAYLGSIYNDVLPWTGGGNAECKIEYMCDWIALVTVSSSNIEPRLWTMNTMDGVWRGSQGNLTAGTGIDISDATPSSEYTIKTAIKVTGVEYKNNDTVQSNALKFVRLTQAQYDALTAKDADTLYMIVG